MAKKVNSQSKLKKIQKIIKLPNESNRKIFSAKSKTPSNRAHQRVQESISKTKRSQTGFKKIASIDQQNQAKNQ